MCNIRAQADKSLLSTRILRTYPDPETAERWGYFLTSTPQASHFVSPEYFLEPRLTGKRSFAILAEHGTEIVACLTGWHEGSELISGLPTNPQLVIRDTSDRYHVEESLALSLLEEAAGSSFVAVHSWSESKAFEDLHFWLRQCDSTYVLDLSLDEDTLFRKLDSTRRRGIRGGLKRGLVVREAAPEDLLKFYEVLNATHKRIGMGSPMLISDFLIPETNRKLLVAYYNGQCVAGTTIRYQAGMIAEYSENASLPEFWQCRPNDLLLWEAIKWAKVVGCTGLNLGGNNLFKKEFGGRLQPIYRLSLDKSFLRFRHRREYVEMFARRVYHAIKSRMVRSFQR